MRAAGARLWQWPLRLALYAVPLGLYALLCWRLCGADVLALPRMVPVPGALDLVDTISTAPSSARARSTTVVVGYRYAVAGREYHGENMTCCRLLSEGSMVDPMYEMRDRLLPWRGRQVTVWVDPTEPGRAVLFRYVPKAALLVMGGGLLFGFVSLLTLDRYLRRRWQRSAPRPAPRQD